MEIIDKLNKEGFVVTSIDTFSMEPMIQKGTKVIIEKYQNKLKKYDVVLYLKNNNYILHRLIKIKNNKLILRGDNNLALETININQVIGILKSYYIDDKYIEVTNKLNKQYYYKSLLTYPLRLLNKKYANK